MADWTNGEPLIATAEHLATRWSGDPTNFRCGFCGCQILLGERWCFVYTNDLVGAGGNPLACGTCIDLATSIAGFNGESLREVLRDRWVHQCEEWRAFTQSSRWWRFMRTLRSQIEQDLGR